MTLQGSSLVERLAGDILHPSIPDAIVIFQIAMFSTWLLLFLFLLFRQIRIKRQIEQFELSDYDRLSSREEDSLPPVLHDHLSVIKRSAKSAAALDAGALARHTFDRINTGAAALRSVLSLFLILGLLGTLIGLSISLSQFSQSIVTSPDSARELTSEALQAGLRGLLERLGVAFVPSVVGVLLTLVGVLLFTFFMRYVGGPLANLIEQRTIGEWVPELTPSDKEKEFSALSELQKIVQANIEVSKENKAAADEFRTVADALASDAGELGTNVKTASKTLKILSESSQRLSDFSENFVESTKNLISFQEELRSIYQQVHGISSTFSESVTELLKENRENHQSLGKELVSSQDAAREVFERLKVYEEGYVESRQEIDKGLVAVLSSAQATYEKIGLQNQALADAVAESVGKPVTLAISNGFTGLKESTGDVARSVDGIKEEHQVFLTEVRNVKGSIDAVADPIGQSAADIRSIASGFEKATRESLREINEGVRSTTETTKAQLTELVSLSGRVEGLSKSMATVAAKIDTFVSASDQLRTSLERRSTNGLVSAPRPAQQKKGILSRIFGGK